MEDDNQIFYKYRSWSDQFHKDLLLKNELYLSSPDRFNDPFDCTIPICFALLDNKEKIHKYAGYFINKGRANQENLERTYAEEFEKMVYMLTHKVEDFQSLHFKIENAKQKKHFGIISLSKNWNNVLMWSHYSVNHSGYSVGLYDTKLPQISVATTPYRLISLSDCQR